MESLELLKRISGSNHFSLKMPESGLEGEKVAKTYEEFGGTKSLLELLHNGALVINYHHDGEMQNILDFFASVKVNFSQPTNDQVSFKETNQNSGLRFFNFFATFSDLMAKRTNTNLLIVKTKKKYTNVQEFRAAEHCDNLLDLMVEQLGGNLSRELKDAPGKLHLLPEEESQKKEGIQAHLLRSGPYFSILKKVNEVLNEALNGFEDGDLLFDLYCSVTQQPLGYKRFFYKDNKLKLSAPGMQYYLPLKIMESGMFYTYRERCSKSKSKSKEKYKAVHERLQSVLNAYTKETSMQSVSSKDKTGSTLEMSAHSRAGAISLLNDNCLSSKEKEIFTQLPILNQLRQQLVAASDNDQNACNQPTTTDPSAPPLESCPPPYSP